MAHSFVHERLVYLVDTDAAGVVYFNQLLQMCHETYEVWLTHHGLSLQTLLQQGQYAIPLVHAEIDFLGPAHCGDRLLIALTVEWVKEYRFICHYTLQRQDPAPVVPVARAQTQHLCIALPQRERCPLPPPWQKAIRDPYHRVE